MKSSVVVLSLALVVLGLVASSLATRRQPQKVTCAKDKDALADQLACQNFTFDKDYRDHLDYAASSIEYCEFDGTFVFYSETRFRGNVKYGYRNKKDYLKDLHPIKSHVTAVKSVRLIGHDNAWDANTLTFFEGRNFTGEKEEFDEKKSHSTNLKFSPSSVIVTGEEFWTIWFGKDGTECRALEPSNRATKRPKFITSLTKYDLNNIVEVKIKNNCPPQN